MVGSYFLKRWMMIINNVTVTAISKREFLYLIFFQKGKKEQYSLQVHGLKERKRPHAGAKIWKSLITKALLLILSSSTPFLRNLHKGNVSIFRASGSEYGLTSEWGILCSESLLTKIQRIFLSHVIMQQKIRSRKKKSCNLFFNKLWKLWTSLLHWGRNRLCSPAGVYLAH